MSKPHGIILAGGDSLRFAGATGLHKSLAPIADLLALRRSRQAALAMLAVQPDMPWGIARLKGDKITDFTEKPPLDRGWVNGGIFAVSAAILPHIHAPHEMLEREPMARLIAESRMPDRD